jgi:hypothetical protein
MTVLRRKENGMQTEAYSEAYKARCIKRLEGWGAPITGWMCVDVYDVADDAGYCDPDNLVVCDLCDCPRVRYVHVMHHPDYFEEIKVGCICAGIMEENILAAKERERVVKNRMNRKRNYLKQQWYTKPNGNHVLRYKGGWITIVPSRYYSGSFGVFCNGKREWAYKGAAITDLRTAALAAFDLVDPPVGQAG